MKRALLLLHCALAGCASDVTVEPAKGVVKDPGSFPHVIWTRVLQKFNRGGFVDYKGLLADRAEFDEYLGLLAKYSPAANPELFPRPEDRMAYLINAYNAYTMRGVIDRYPLESVKFGLTGNDFWITTAYPLGPNETFTLAQIEKQIQALGDPRIHFAINCASLGCPRLPEKAFEPDRLEEQLASEAKKFVEEDRNVRVEGNTVHLSSIFNWYEDEFLDWQFWKAEPKDILAYIKGLGRELPAGRTRVVYLDYDWGLNEQK